MFIPDISDGAVAVAPRKRRVSRNSVLLDVTVGVLVAPAGEYE